MCASATDVLRVPVRVYYGLINLEDLVKLHPWHTRHAVVTSSSLVMTNNCSIGTYDLDPPRLEIRSVSESVEESLYMHDSEYKL